MNRRKFLIRTSPLVFSLSGCSKTSTPGTGARRLALYVEIEEVDQGWHVSVRVRNVHDWDGSFHDVNIIGYAKNGGKICEEYIGEVELEQTVEMKCGSLPHQLTATAAESPCNGQFIIEELTYNGKDQDGNHSWNVTHQNCEK